MHAYVIHILRGCMWWRSTPRPTSSSHRTFCCYHTIWYVINRSHRWQHIFISNGQTTHTRLRIRIQIPTMTHTRDMPYENARNSICRNNVHICSYTHSHTAPHRYMLATQPTDGINRVYLNKIALRSEQFTFNVQTVHTENIIISFTFFYDFCVFFVQVSKATYKII